MPSRSEERRPHLVLDGTAEARPFTAHSGGGSDKPPARPRAAHSQFLRGRLDTLREMATTVSEFQENAELRSGTGLEVQFVGQADAALAFESLANEPRRIELLSVRSGELGQIANVFVPTGKLTHFENYLEEYRVRKLNKNGVAIDHSALIDTIADIRPVDVESLWTDDLDLLPQDAQEVIWWEVWLPVRGMREDVLADFLSISGATGLGVGTHRANFPE